MQVFEDFTSDAYWYAEEEDDERKYWTHSQWDAFNKQRAIDTEKQLKKMLGARYVEPKKV
jgi:hypothetical protein